MINRIMKIATSCAYLLLAYVTWQWFKGDLAWGFSLGCVAVSGLWLVLTYFELGHLFRTYFDILSRLKILLPIGIGVILSGLAAWWAGPELRIVGFVELALWIGIYARYRFNKGQYKKQGHGPLPKNAWVNPPADVLQHFDLILTSGNMANRLHESVGHGEIAVKMPDGKLYLFSSYMERGCVLQEAERVANALLRRGHYVVLRPVRPLTAEQLAVIPNVVNIMLAQNAAWRSRTQAARTRLINRLPLPAAAKAWLVKKLRVTGYDWVGLAIGQKHSNRWTCIGACCELMERVGYELKQAYGTGLLGFGTGLLDPIKPARMLSDTSLRMLTSADQAEYERVKGSSTGTK